MHYPALEEVRKILVIKLRHHGDVLLTSPVFSCLQLALPQSTIDGFIYQETAPMLEGHPAIRKLHLYDKGCKKKSLLGRWREEIGLLRQVRRESYDLVINLTEGDRGAIVAAFSKSSLRVGFDPGKSGFWGKARLFSHLVKNCPTPRHTVERNLDALRRIGIFPTPEERELIFHIPASERKQALEKLAVHQIRAKNYVVVHPVSRWRFKCFPVPKMAELIKWLYHTGHQVVLTGSSDPHELEMIREIIALCPNQQIVSLAGQINLKELGAIIESAHALICVDSLPLHLASALKTPVIALFGPTSELNWGPWQHPHARVVTQQLPCRPCYMDGCGGSKRSDCLTTLSVSQVKQAFEDLQDDLHELLHLNSDH